MSTPPNVEPARHGIDEEATSESLQGWIAPLTTERLLRQAVEQAFDYRGDVTLKLKTGETVEGFVFDRTVSASLAASYLRILPSTSDERRKVAYIEITSLEFTGRDAAAGKSWEAWAKKHAAQPVNAH